MTYKITGKVVKGKGYGKKIGFPTANLSRNGFVKMKPKPAFGVYSGRADFGAKSYRAGIIIGPLDKKGLPKIEAHMMEFRGNIYGKVITLSVEKFIRKFKNFKTEKELIIQIKKDLKKC